MIVVSNTSPIPNLAAVGQLAVLQQLYEKVVIPPAVYGELISMGAGQPGAMEVQTLGWIETRPVTDRVLVTALQMELDEGEAEAIALAVELKADLVLLDERRGRAVASRLGLRFIGLLGVLIEANRRSTMTKSLVVDADGHILEPPDLWERYLEPQYRDRAMRIAVDQQGYEYVEIDRKMSLILRGGTLGRWAAPTRTPVNYSLQEK